MNNQRFVVMSSVVLAACASDYDLKGKAVNVDPGQVTECPFTPVSGTKLSQYDCNPVFDGTGGFHVTEVMGHPFYQMWYTTWEGDETLDGSFEMNYAVSSNGTDWDSHPANPLFASYPGAWDQDAVAGEVVVWDPVESQYVMSYQGINLGVNSWGLGVATSKDGIAWDKHPNNPVIDFNASEFSLTEVEQFEILLGGTTDKIKPCWPLTITVNDRGTLQGYIGASKWQEVIEISNDLFSDDISAPCEVYQMSAFDAGSWNINQTSPVLTADRPYDEFGVSSAAVVNYDGVDYMFYVGFEAWKESEQAANVIENSQSTLNLATSTDGGLTWIKDPNNPLPINLTKGMTEDDLRIGSIGAQVIGTRIHLWVGDSYCNEDIIDPTNNNPNACAAEGLPRTDPNRDSAIGYFYFEPDIEPHE